MCRPWKRERGEMGVERVRYFDKKKKEKKGGGEGIGLESFDGVRSSINESMKRNIIKAE